MSPSACLNVTRQRANIMHALETRTQLIIQRLEQEGWYLQRHGANHDIYRHELIRVTITLPRHRTVKPAVARSIAKTAGWEDQI